MSYSPAIHAEHLGYNVWIDLALMAAVFAMIGLILHATKPPKRGATPMTRDRIEMMQSVRRLENDTE